VAGHPRQTSLPKRQQIVYEPLRKREKVA
jgi:hypothetical protein